MAVFFWVKMLSDMAVFLTQTHYKQKKEGARRRWLPLSTSLYSTIKLILKYFQNLKNYNTYISSVVVFLSHDFHHVFLSLHPLRINKRKGLKNVTQ